MSRLLNLPGGAVTLEAGPLAEPGSPWNRTAYAAVHVVSDPLAECDPWLDSSVDWDRTLAFREHLWSLGFGVAEAMDTAQRGMGLDWPTSLEFTIDDVIRAYEEQCEAVEAAGSRVILMASRALVAAARGPEDYAHVYNRVLSGLAQPAILHWLGEMFDPALEGYWGSQDHMTAMDTAVSVIEDNADKIDGIKISLLSEEKEVAMRRLLPEGVAMYTGDDFNYPKLIEGDDAGYSHALLGIFDPIAPAAARALSQLAVGDKEAYHAAFAPTVPLSRHIFRAPTRFYKTGVVFMAYLNGHQDHFTMIGGQESTRSTLHLADIVRLANDAGLFTDPDKAAARARHVFAARGVTA